jgi:hypothetical protein
MIGRPHGRADRKEGVMAKPKSGTRSATSNPKVLDPAAITFAAFAVMEGIVDILYESGAISEAEARKVIKGAADRLRQSPDARIKKGAALIEHVWPAFSK